MNKKHVAIAIVCLIVYVLFALGIPQYLMQHQLRDMGMRAHADIVAQCEKEHCWHL